MNDQTTTYRKANNTPIKGQLTLNNYDEYENYEQYEEEFDPMRTDRQARRKRKPKIKHVPKKSEHQVIAEITSKSGGSEGGFQTTYQPGLFEQSWLPMSLRAFYDQELIIDVLARVKGGKEASVYRCLARPSTGMELVAAKVYRPRMFRNLRNDKMYREGRQILKENGKAVKGSDHRSMRAIGKKTDFGQQLEHTSWLMYEYQTLERLYKAGASVPKPLAVSENAILMSYCGDEKMAAHTLNEVELSDKEAVPLFREALRNIELMLQNNLIHGDLSAYNILYWEGKITLIDFPQLTNSLTNGQAYFILQRDIERICEYFIGQGVSCDSDSITDNLWKRYVDGVRVLPLPPEEEDEEEIYE